MATNKAYIVKTLRQEIERGLPDGLNEEVLKKIPR